MAGQEAAMRTTLVAVLIGTMATAAGCKSEQEKQAETAAAELAQARAKAAEAQAQLAAAEKKVEQSAEQLGKQGEALGAQGAALGAQGAALGAQAAATGMQAAAIAMENLAKSMGKPGATGPLVDFRDLKALLPETIGTLKRTSAEGEKSAAMGFGVSQATGKYKGDGEGRVRIKLIDTAGVGGMAIAAFGLAGLEVDKETEDGYERTSTLGGRKVFEKYNSRSKRGEIKALVGNRFVVEVDGDDVPMETIKDVLGSKLDLAKLETLAPAPGPATAKK
jgi:hypothetical protein